MSTASGVPASPLWGDLSVRIDRPDGTIIRWAGDELDAANVPVDLQFGTSMPGGFKGATATLFRALDLPGREGMFDDVTILGPGQEIVWQGRLQQMPTSTDSGGRVTPQAVGWSAHLEDDATLSQVYVDRDLGGWSAMPAARRQAILGASFAPADGSVRWDDTTAGSAGPVVDLRRAKGTAAWSSNAARPHITSTYNCGGARVEAIEMRFRNPTNLAGWALQLVAFSDLACSASIGTHVVPSVSIVNGALAGWTCPAGTRAIEASLISTVAPGGNPDIEYGLMLAEVAVYGSVSLPWARTDSYTGAGQGPYGYRASDVLPDVLAKAAPLLRWSSESVTATDFVIRHLVFGEPTTAAAIVEHLNRYHLWDWAVWEDKTFWWRPRSGGRTWKIATADGLDLDLEGDTSDNVFNGLAITYTDYAGVEHTVGPPGSTAERTDDRLLSHDPNNPATLHGLRRWAHLQLSVAADHDSACTIGQAWLGVQAQATRRGSATVRGTVHDDAGNPHPAWRVRAGDTLIVTDRPDDPPRRIIETSYTHRERSNQLTLDSTAATADALIERISAALIGVL